MSVVHKIGLYLCFGSGVLWLWCLVYITLGLHPVQSSRLLLSCRVLACALNSATFAVMLICGEVARARFSASKSSIRRFVIMEKAPTRAFSWLKAATTDFTFKTLLRHYAKRALTPRSLNVKLGPRRKGHIGRAVWLA